MSKKLVKPYSIGDRVEIVKSSAWFHRVGDVGLITHVEYQRFSKRFEYFFEGTGWFEHDCFKLVKKATLASIKEALKLEEEDDEDD